MSKLQVIIDSTLDWGVFEMLVMWKVHLLYICLDYYSSAGEFLYEEAFYTKNAHYKVITPPKAENIPVTEV